MKQYKNRWDCLTKVHGRNVLNFVERTFPKFYQKVVSPESSRGIWEKVENCDYSYELMDGEKILATIAGEYAPWKGKVFSFWTYKKPNPDKKGKAEGSNHDWTEEDLNEFNQLLGKLRFSQFPQN